MKKKTESASVKKARAERIVALLEQKYPESECALKYSGEGWKLLVLGRLSAQCTDARVNIVGEELFKKFPDPQSLARCELADLEEVIRPCGLYHTKAKDIKASCALLCERYGGKVPDDMDTLLSFPGVGRKIANLLLGDLYSRPAIVADTHCIRISERLGLTKEGEKDPVRTEKTLVGLIPPEKSAEFCHRLVEFGREVCSARRPDCENCILSAECDFYSNKVKAVDKQP